MHEVLFYLGVWAVSFASSMCRGLRDNLGDNLWQYVSGGATSGFTSFGIIAVWSHYSDSSGSYSFWIGTAALLGIIGKEQDGILRWVLRKVFPIDQQPEDKKDGP